MQRLWKKITRLGYWIGQRRHNPSAGFSK